MVLFKSSQCFSPLNHLSNSLFFLVVCMCVFFAHVCLSVCGHMHVSTLPSEVRGFISPCAEVTLFWLLFHVDAINQTQILQEQTSVTTQPSLKPLHIVLIILLIIFPIPRFYNQGWFCRGLPVFLYVCIRVCARGYIDETRSVTKQKLTGWDVPVSTTHQHWGYRFQCYTHFLKCGCWCLKSGPHACI